LVLRESSPEERISDSRLAPPLLLESVVVSESLVVVVELELVDSGIIKVGEYTAEKSRSKIPTERRMVF
jgi:hypothetical protein